MSRLLGVVLLVLVVLVAFAYLRREGLFKMPARVDAPDVRAEAKELKEDAKDLGAQAKEKLAEVGSELKDAKITASVKTALGLNRSLGGYSIDVDTENGVVALKGKVNDAEARARAEAVAAEVPEVARVVNQLQVAPGTLAAAPSGGRTLGETVDDESLEMKVRLAFSLNRELKGSDIKVQSFRKAVTLSGEAATPAQRERALQIARETPAVGQVVDQIQVRGATGSSATGGQAPATVPGASTTARAACDTAGALRSLQANPNLSGLDLRVREDAGRLVLNGTARNSTERDLAGFVAREGSGCPVQNEVEVRPATL